METTEPYLLSTCDVRIHLSIDSDISKGLLRHMLSVELEKL